MRDASKRRSLNQVAHRLAELLGVLPGNAKVELHPSTSGIRWQPALFKQRRARFVAGNKLLQFFVALRLLSASPFATPQNTEYSTSQDRGKTTFTRFVHRSSLNQNRLFRWWGRCTQRAAFSR